jgi:hypothetical protein
VEVTERLGPEGGKMGPGSEVSQSERASTHETTATQDAVTRLKELLPLLSAVMFKTQTHDLLGPRLAGYCHGADSFPHKSLQYHTPSQSHDRTHMSVDTFLPSSSPLS